MIFESPRPISSFSVASGFLWAPGILSLLGFTIVGEIDTNISMHERNTERTFWGFPVACHAPRLHVPCAMKIHLVYTSRDSLLL
ncbi:hypothetical protein BDV29DRAFT_40268 [Aspergillus leporis]|uniref:Uncharacterized protein n=1 Tax=Aspergillus leporis TaxID=41062 RepID=A0A5N5WS22_9EURO|nr:hypothetical protein BDV29DRAFT_40268 [Aspergillus leporis]